MLVVEHLDPDLERIERETAYPAGYAVPVIKQFRLLMQQIRDVTNKNKLYQFRGRRLEKLSGNRGHQHSMRLNKKYRLIVEFIETTPEETIRIIAIEKHYE